MPAGFSKGAGQAPKPSDEGDFTVLYLNPQQGREQRDHWNNKSTDKKTTNNHCIRVDHGSAPHEKGAGVPLNFSFSP